MSNFSKAIEKFKKTKLTKSLLNILPEKEGVYIFWDKDLNPIYIGKSTNLKKRIQSYFLSNLGPKTKKMVEKIYFFSMIRVNSELEALLVEASLIKKFQPKYNSNLKDDKHPLYIFITKEKYPRVLTARRLQISNEKNDKKLAYFGPFPSSKEVAEVLRTLRKIFPFSQHKIEKRLCIYSQLGLCEPCPSEIEKIKDLNQKKLERKKYLYNIKKIKRILSGDIKAVIYELNKEMKELSLKQRFEEASNIRDKIQRLRYITQPTTSVTEFLKDPNLIEDIRKKELLEFKSLLSKYISLQKNISRIECFDVAHLLGTFPTASMVTFINGEPDKRFYRHFIIREAKKGDDISSLKEVSIRRSNHFDDWGKPDLILVDGGKAQVAIFWAEMKKFNIPVVGLAKRFETLIIPIFFHGKLAYKEIRLPMGPSLNLLERIRDEAHRFARRLHHKLLKDKLLS